MLACWVIESAFSTAYGIVLFFSAFRFCGWISICVPPATFQFKWAGGENFPGFLFAFGALSAFCSHGNEFLGNVSVCTFKFIKRHIHPPEMAINPCILYWIPVIFIFWWNIIHFILFVKKNQVMNIEKLLDRFAGGNIKIINIFRH